MTKEEEYWYVIEEFPKYEVSSWGRVVNSETGRELRQSKTQAGQVKVGLVDDQGVQRTVLVKTLVARAFVPGESPIYDTPINLDGNQENNRHTNLVWRPRWFALQWARQNTRISEGRKPHYEIARSVIDLDTREIYENVVEAAAHTGSAHSEIFMSCQMQQLTWPDDKRFRFVIDDRLGEIGSEEEWVQVNFDYANHRYSD